MKWLLLLLLAAAPALAANLIPQSSFENGTEAYIVYGSEAGERFGNDSSVLGRLVQTNVVHGSNSLMWKTRFFTPPIYLLAGTYTFTLSGQTSSGHDINIGLFSSFSGYAAIPSDATHTLTTASRRYTNTLTAASNAWYSIKLYTQNTTANNWIDAIQLETGTVATAYSPMASVEVGLSTTNINHILNKETQNYIQLKWWNEAGAIGATSIVQVFNYENTNFLVPAIVSTNALVAGATTINVPMPSGASGWFRAVSYQPTIDKSWSELIFLIRPYAAGTPYNTNALFAGHANTSPYGLQRNVELGQVWNRDLSPGYIVRWDQYVSDTVNTGIQPGGSGAFVWGAPSYADIYMSIASTNGTIPLLVMTPGLDGHWPTNATVTNGPIVSADINAYSNYNWQVANRYSPAPTKAFYYEIGNEWHNIKTTNYVGGQSPTDFYGGSDPLAAPYFLAASNRARFMVAGAQAIKAACPHCICIGLAGENDPDRGWMTWTNMTVGEQGLFDILSVHIYPIDQGNVNPNTTTEDDLDQNRSAYKWAVKGFNKTLWNSEMGNQGAKGGRIGYVGLHAPVYPTYGALTPEAGRDFGMGQRKVVPVTRESRTVIRCLGMGFRKVFSYFDAQLDDDMWGEQAYQGSSMEWSGAPRQGAAAALIAANYFIRYPGLGRITNFGSLNVEAYVFTNELGTVVGIWKSDNAQTTLGFTNNNFAIWDVMGNYVATNQSSYTIWRVPNWFVSGTLSTAQLRDIVTNATISSYTDTTGPNISIDASPVGVVTNGTHFFKWTITDRWKQAWSIGSYAPDNTNNRSKIKFYAGDAWKDWGESNHAFYPFTINRQYRLFVEGYDYNNNTMIVTGPAFGILETELPPPWSCLLTNRVVVSGRATLTR